MSQVEVTRFAGIAALNTIADLSTKGLSAVWLADRVYLLDDAGVAEPIRVVPLPAPHNHELGIYAGSAGAEQGAGALIPVSFPGHKNPIYMLESPIGETSE